MKITRKQEYMQSPPRFYGVAWTDHSLRVTTWYPIPLNLLARWGRGVWEWIVYGRGSRVEKLVAEAVAKRTQEMAHQRFEEEAAREQRGRETYVAIVENLRR